MRNEDHFLLRSLSMIRPVDTTRIMVFTHRAYFSQHIRQGGKFTCNRDEDDHSQHTRKTYHSPLRVISAICALSGRSLRASKAPLFRRLLLSAPSLSLALSAEALRRIGLELILVSMLMRASESAVEPSMRLSSFSGFSTFWKMDNCSFVGVMKTTYSSATYHLVNGVSGRFDQATHV